MMLIRRGAFDMFERDGSDFSRRRDRPRHAGAGVLTRSLLLSVPVHTLRSLKGVPIGHLRALEDRGVI